MEMGDTCACVSRDRFPYVHMHTHLHAYVGTIHRPTLAAGARGRQQQHAPLHAAALPPQVRPPAPAPARTPTGKVKGPRPWIVKTLLPIINPFRPQTPLTQHQTHNKTTGPCPRPRHLGGSHPQPPTPHRRRHAPPRPHLLSLLLPQQPQNGPPRRRRRARRRLSRALAAEAAAARHTAAGGRLGSLQSRAGAPHPGPRVGGRVAGVGGGAVAAGEEGGGAAVPAGGGGAVCARGPPWAGDDGGWMDGWMDAGFRWWGINLDM